MSYKITQETCGDLRLFTITLSSRKSSNEQLNVRNTGVVSLRKAGSMKLLNEYMRGLVWKISLKIQVYQKDNKKPSTNMVMLAKIIIFQVKCLYVFHLCETVLFERLVTT